MALSEDVDDLFRVRFADAKASLVRCIVVNLLIHSPSLV